MRRKMKVYYKPTKYDKTPMIRITNHYLAQYNFLVGDTICVEYRSDKLIITKHEKRKSKK